MSAPTHPLATVGRVPAARLLARLEEALALYVAAMELPPGAAAIKRAQVPGHLRDPSARAVLATTTSTTTTTTTTTTGELAGFGYGVAGRAGDFWWDRVLAGLMVTASPGSASAATARRWLDRSFEICELHVRPDCQRQGLGRAILVELLAEAPYDTALLSTEDVDSPARRLYRSLGFVDVLRQFVFAGDPRRFAILGVTLPLTTTRISPAGPPLAP
jgi:ribosomal protein S18 acetylase RimI-like enzyme